MFILIISIVRKLQKLKYAFSHIKLLVIQTTERKDLAKSFMVFVSGIKLRDVTPALTNPSGTSHPNTELEASGTTILGLLGLLWRVWNLNHVFFNTFNLFIYQSPCESWLRLLDVIPFHYLTQVMDILINIKKLKLSQFRLFTSLTSPTRFSCTVFSLYFFLLIQPAL